MSACRMNEYQIGAMVGSVERYDTNRSHHEWSGFKESALDIALMLDRENKASILARYPYSGGDGDNDPKKIASAIMQGRCDLLPVAQIFKALDYYEYQSCEHDGWKDSRAKKWVEMARSLLISKILGYEQAEWGITSPEGKRQAVRP